MTVEELKNRFKSVERIKKGGQKVVFKAKDSSNTYALKLISCPNDPRVLQEIKIVSSYDIQYVPKMIETGTVIDEADGETVIYIIEEFVEGQLTEQIEQTEKEIATKLDKLPDILKSDGYPDVQAFMRTFREMESVAEQYNRDLAE